MIFPDIFIIKSFDLFSEQPVNSSESRNLKILTRTRSGHRWDARFRIDVEPDNELEAGGILRLLQQDGEVLVYTDASWLQDIGTVFPAQNYSAGASSIQITENTVQKGIKIGHKLNFGNHSKLYEVKGASGDIIQIFPALTTAVTQSTIIDMDTPAITMELAPDMKRSAQYSAQLRFDLSRVNLRMVEAL